MAVVVFGNDGEPMGLLHGVATGFIGNAHGDLVTGASAADTTRRIRRAAWPTLSGMLAASMHACEQMSSEG